MIKVESVLLTRQDLKMKNRVINGIIGFVSLSVFFLLMMFLTGTITA